MGISKKKKKENLLGLEKDKSNLPLRERTEQAWI